MPLLLGRLIHPLDFHALIFTAGKFPPTCDFLMLIKDQPLKPLDITGFLSWFYYITRLSKVFDVVVSVTLGVVL